MDWIFRTLLGLIIAICIYLMIWKITTNAEVKDWCTEAGGVLIFGDKGHFKVCLDPSAIIEKPNE